MRMLLRRAAALLVLALAVVAGAARADTAVALTQSYAGNLSFTGTQVTIRTAPNVGKGNGKKAGDPCAVYGPSTIRQATLSGIPTGATVVSAQLYWAGSGHQANAVYTVNFDGQQVTAARQYFSTTAGGGIDYFSGAADVTAQVAAKKNGTYSFSGLSVANGEPWCSSQAVVGGFSLLVIYSSASEPYRALNLYEGFQYFRYNGITLNLNNFLVPALLPATATARLGHITWEGDPTLQQDGEQLLFNGTEITDAMNPAGNQFNSASNINGDAASYGIDFDAYSIAPSSGLIKPGQTSATTRYQSGQDLVLLNAEIIAIPNVPTADLSISMARAAALQAGTDTSYVLTVRNLGPSSEPGPITVTDTVPAGMSVSAAGGTGWSCVVSGQTVTCTTQSSLGVNGVLPALTLTLRPSAAGTYTNRASVQGQDFDNQPANNSASDTATATDAGGNGYEFTTVPCGAGTQIGSALCQRFTGPVDAGSVSRIYLTAVSGSPALATPPSTTADIAIPVNFSLSCVDPVAHQGVQATLAGLTLPLCSGNGAVPAAGGSGWSAAVSLTFPKGSPSAQLGPGFSYEDVGQVTLNAVDASKRRGGASFVVKPVLLQFAAIKRTSDSAPNPPEPAAGVQRPGFVRAGEAFTLSVGARTTTGKWAPNFGNETAMAGIVFVQVAPGGFPQLQLGGSSASGGFVTGTAFKWDAAGVLNLTPTLADYLGAKGVAGVSSNVGRFYPDHFDTTVTAPFICLTKMACPASLAMTGAAYSGQPFKVHVQAMGMTPKVTLPGYGGKTVTLSAVDRPAGASFNPGGGAIGDGSVLTADADSAADATPHYDLPLRFAASQPRALNWTAPTPIYLRASVDETVVDAAGKEQPVKISSMRPADTVEGGITVVNGRLQLANAFGSELLNLPVRMRAEYWNGSTWDTNTADSASIVPYGGHLEPTQCTGKFASGTGEANCNGVLKIPASGSVLLTNGAGRFWLPAPGAGNMGSAYLRVLDSPPWLPGARARAVFGVYRSPLIYIREVH